jgi:hypothetical protein
MLLLLSELPRHTELDPPLVERFQMRDLGLMGTE